MQCKNVTALGFATGPSLNPWEGLPRSSDHDGNYYRCQQVFNGQYIEMSVNGASMICGCVSSVLTQWFSRCNAYPMYQHLSFAKETSRRSPPHFENESQLSIKDSWFCTYSNYSVIWSLLCITNVFASSIGKRDCNTVTIPFWDLASTECQRFVVL